MFNFQKSLAQSASLPSVFLIIDLMSEPLPALQPSPLVVQSFKDVLVRVTDSPWHIIECPKYL